MSHSIEERIELLKSFCIEDPKDPFNHYSLLLETQKVNYQESEKIGDFLILEFPNYLATYYMFGQLLEEEKPLKALEVYRKGIEIASQENNIKTGNELKSALQNLEFELD